MTTAIALALALALAGPGPAASPAQATGAQGQATAKGDTPVSGAAAPSNNALRDSAVDAQTRVLAAGLRCPVCQGQSIQDSEAPLAGEMRELIREKLRQGDSPAEVRAYFVSKYGEWILLQPEAHGFTLAVYLLPVLGLLAGAVVVFLAARRWTRPVAAGAAEAEEPTVSVTEDRS